MILGKGNHLTAESIQGTGPDKLYYQQAERKQAFLDDLFECL
jgi:hypothetical protein